jgi:4-azaleucine resistance transporter AzlC
MLGYLPVAFAFGVLGGVNGLPAWASLLMSILVYAGASQFAALQLLSAGAALPGIIATTFILNLRHFLLAAAIAPRLKDFSTVQGMAFGIQLTDECYAVQDSRYRAEADRPKAEIFSLNLFVYLSWILGTAGGIVFGGVVPGIDRIGLDFALAAMFIAILAIDAVTSRHDVWVALLSATMAVALTASGAALWATVLATCCAATAGYVFASADEEGEELA